MRILGFWPILLATAAQGDSFDKTIDLAAQINCAQALKVLDFEPTVTATQHAIVTGMIIGAATSGAPHSEPRKQRIRVVYSLTRLHCTIAKNKPLMDVLQKMHGPISN